MMSTEVNLMKTKWSKVEYKEAFFVVPLKSYCVYH